MRTITSIVWAECPQCEAEHLVGVDANGSPVAQFGTLTKEEEDVGGGFTFSYSSQPSVAREGETVDLELFSEDEDAVRTQALLLAVNNMTAMIPFDRAEEASEEQQRPSVH